VGTLRKRKEMDEKRIKRKGKIMNEKEG